MKQNAKQLGRLFALYIKTGRIYVWLYMLATLVKAFIPLIRVIAIARMITTFAHPQALAWLSVIVFCILYEDIYYKFCDFIDVFIIHNASLHTQTSLIQKAFSIPYVFWENSDLHNDIKLISESSTVIHTTCKHIMTVIQRMIEFFSISVYVASFSLLWGAGLISVQLFSLYLYTKTANLSWKTTLGTTKDEREATYIMELLTSRKSIPEIQLFSSHIPLQNRYIQTTNRIIAIKKETMLKNMIIQYVPNLVLGALCIVMVLQYTLMYTQQVINGADLSGLLSSLLLMIGTVQVFSINFNNMVTSYNKYRKYDIFIHQDFTINHDNTQCISDCNMPVAMENCTFSYGTQTRKIIRNVSVSIAEGECIVIVGSNGCGKSTLVKLMLGLLHPHSGNVWIYGQSATQVQDSERIVLSAIFQDYSKYRLQLDEIVANGRSSDQDVASLIEKVGLSSTVARLENGYHTLLGKEFQGGTDLSEGQWQKVNVARVLASKAEVLIFDEPTASLDPVTESLFYEEIVRLKSQKTIVIVSHRLGVTRIADRVLYMEDGCIHAQGTHQSLLETCAAYADMYQNQAQWYGERSL